jgi:O-antigen/teichoic acid export membrane protein
MSRKLVLNSLSGTALYGVNIVVAFIMSPIIIRALGNRDYGLWELVMSVIGYMGLLDLGIGPALVRFVAVADGKQDKDDLQKTISTSFVFFVVVGVAAVLSFLLLGYFPAIIAGSEAKDIANLGTVFMLLGLNAGMTFPLQVFIATLMGVQRHYFINNVRILLLVVRAATNYYFLTAYPGKGLLIMALLEPVFTAVQVAAFVGAVYLDREIPNIALASVSWTKAKEMMAFGAKSATMMVASRLQNQSVPLIIGNMLGLGQIVYFVMPNRLVDYAKGLSYAIGFPLTPYFGAAVGKGNHEALVSSWLNSSLALQIVSLAMPVVIFFCGETFLGLWIGPEYAVAGRVVLYVLIVGLVADALASNAFRVLTAQGRHGRCALTWFFLSVLSIPAGIGGAYWWGVAGAAAGATMVTVIASIVTVYIACSVIQVSIITFVNKTVIRILVPLLVLATAMGFYGSVVTINSYVKLLFQLVLSGSLYLVAVWFFTLTDEVRKQMLVQIRLKFQ